jgi:hypothetical protein
VLLFGRSPALNNEVERRGLRRRQTKLFIQIIDSPKTRPAIARTVSLITEALPPVVVAEANSVDVKAWAVIVLVIAQFLALPKPWQFLETINSAQRGRPRPIRANK